MLLLRLFAPLRRSHYAYGRFISANKYQSKHELSIRTSHNIAGLNFGDKQSWVRIQLQAVRSESTATKKSARERIDDLIKNSGKKVFVFMKGVPEQPACGYSNAVVQILNAYEVDFDSYNVLEDDEIRQEIKVYSNWPTIPQVYVDKNFVGGCDILIQMHQSNELERLFDSSKPQTL